MNARQTVEWLMSPHNKYDDAKTWKLIQDGRTTGCFQIESQLCKKFCKLLKPDNIEHLAALIAIIRPAVLEALDENGESLAISFCKRKNGEEPIEYLHPSLEPILNTTFAIICFQEQAMRISKELAGFTLQEADALRSAAGKKKPEEMSKIKVKFIEGANKLGILSNEQSVQIFEWIEKSQRYSFNLSHSISYAVLAYIHSYIKVHLTKKFICSWLSYTKDEQHKYEEVEKLVLDSKLFLNDNGRPIDILGPDFRTLNEEFQIEDDDVRFGITDIRGVGDSSFKTLVEKVNSYELKTNTFRDNWNWYEFLVFSTQLSKSTVEALISSGAIAYFKVDKRQMYYEYDKLSSLTAPEAAWLVENAKQFDNISSALTSLARPKKDGGGTANKNRVEAVLGLVSSIKNPPYSLKDTYSFIAFEEKKSLGVALTCSKVDDFDNESANCVCKDLNDGKTGFIVINAEIGRCAEHVIGKGKNKGKTMAFLTITDSTGGFDNIPCFSDTWKQYGSLLATGNTVVLQGERKDKKSGLMIKKVRQL